MKIYLMKIVGAVLICVFTDIALPEKWSKYIKIITGLIIISTIASPLEKPLNLNFKEYFKASEKLEQTGEEYQISLIKKEFEKNVSNDIKNRIYDEFKKEISADVVVSLNDENKISGIKKIELKGEINDEILNRINEIYAPKEIFSDGY